MYIVQHYWNCFRNVFIFFLQFTARNRNTVVLFLLYNCVILPYFLILMTACVTFTTYLHMFYGYSIMLYVGTTLLELLYKCFYEV